VSEAHVQQRHLCACINRLRRVLVTPLLVVIAVALVVGCVGVRHSGLAAECPPLRETHIPSPAQPLNIDKIKQQLREYQARDYSRDLVDVLADARAYVQRRAAQAHKAALVLDIDETSLSNWPNIEANDFGFILDGTCDRLPKGPCGFTAWVRKHAAEAIMPTLALFSAARTHGVFVFFITGRREADRDVTVANLNGAGFKDWERLVMRTDKDTAQSVQEYKTEERRRISAEGYTIVANIGDQQSDLDGGYAECTFKLPNPFYFIR
jgi:acid phosphatase